VHVTRESRTRTLLIRPSPSMGILETHCFASRHKRRRIRRAFQSFYRKSHERGHVSLRRTAFSRLAARFYIPGTFNARAEVCKVGRAIRPGEDAPEFQRMRKEQHFDVTFFLRFASERKCPPARKWAMQGAEARFQTLSSSEGNSDVRNSPR
jgi:hypothetical protein